MVTTLIARMSDLLAPISKSTTRTWSIYANGSVRGISLVWRCRNNGKAQLSSALDRISERITLASKTPSRPEAIGESTIEKQQFYLYFNMIWRREWDSNPRYSFPHTRFPSVRLKPLGHLSGRPSLETARSFLQAVAAGGCRDSANILNNKRIFRHNPPSVEPYFGLS
jgi:hypothetical protein